ncbi:MAG: orotidine-5'-phosphate decarboxylase [Alphaproteobacteria bacterium]|nr:orotidine-5'-phosphate decarboxylase [Alphaproteobacteria bacterium]
MTDPARRIFCAIDTTDLDRAIALGRMLGAHLGGIKLGLEFMNAHGPEGAARVVDTGVKLFLDLKFHDIPNTVAGAVRAATARCRPFMLNVHASGGAAMMTAAAEAASEAAAKAGVPRPVLLAVTVLTSLDDRDLAEIGQTGQTGDQVLRLAELAQRCGLDGVVCSAHEIKRLRAICGPGFTLVVPGIRPAWSGADDQKRVLTPAAAVRDGADYLVIGRPITAAADPIETVERIAMEMTAEIAASQMAEHVGNG